MSAEYLERIRSRIRALEDMPAVSVIVLPLVSMLQLPPEQVDLEQVFEMVSYDSTIAAQCLRMANSPLFGRRNTETVRGAVTALGIRRVVAILMGCCLNRIVPAEQWVLPPAVFWRHCLGCAFVSRELAQLIDYPDPEKAYLAGLLHDLGILVNTLTCGEEFRRCLQAAQDTHVAIHQSELQNLGFTHCETGRILGESWHFSPDIINAIELHHCSVTAPTSGSLVWLVQLSDVLCRLRGLGYGYDEHLSVDLTGEDAWTKLLQNHPALAKMDLARLTMDIDGAMDEIGTVVDAVFNPADFP